MVSYRPGWGTRADDDDDDDRSGVKAKALSKAVSQALAKSKVRTGDQMRTTTAARGRDTYLQTIARNSMKFRRKWQDALKTFPDDKEYDWLPLEEMGMTDELDLAIDDADFS